MSTVSCWPKKKSLSNVFFGKVTDVLFQAILEKQSLARIQQLSSIAPAYFASAAKLETAWKLRP